MTTKTSRGFDRMAQRIAQLEAAYGKEVVEHGATKVERDELRKDAERYRWLRDNWTSIVSHMDSPFEIRFEIMPSKWGNFAGPVIDAAIDAAMGEKP